VKLPSGFWYSHFMPVRPRYSLKPRKRPVQARSETTVAALFEASIQVLLAAGYRKFTTTRVAERAGVSVGTLYQYFPNRQALVTSVIERYLDDLTSTIALHCGDFRGQTLDEMARGFVDVVIAAKWAHIEVAQALHEPLADVGGAHLVRAAAIRTAGSVGEILRSCADASFREADRLALLIVISCSSVLQAAIAGQATELDRETLRTHMRAMVLGYLREMRTGKPRIAAR
jgi:AcrR family transcriptional regulator